MTACEIYCGGYFIDEDENLIPSCFSKAMELSKNKKEAAKYFKVKKKLKNMKNQDIWLYNDWAEEVKETIAIHNKVVAEHIQWKEQHDIEHDIEYYPAHVPVPEGTKIPFDHYFAPQGT